MTKLTFKSSDIHRIIKQYICEEILKDAQYPLQDDQALLTGGLIDSFYFIQIALFIEEKFGIEIPDEQLTVENMDSLSKIVQHVQYCADKSTTV